MKMAAGKIIAQALEDAGVRFSFGIPGTHNIELYDAFSERPSLTPVLVTDEQSASFMADGVARGSDEIAVVNVVPGAGLSHALSGIAEAFMDQVAMLVLASGVRADTGHAYQLHDIDQAAMVRPVCKKVFEPQKHSELYKTIREACDLSKQDPKGPVTVIVPANLYIIPQDITSEDLNYIRRETQHPIDEQSIKAIVDLLNQSQKIGFYVGSGAIKATDEIDKLANILDAVVFTTLSAKGIFPETDSRWVWNGMGRALPPSLKDFDQGLDCLLAVGCRFGEVATASYGFHPPENLIHIDIDKKVFNRNYPAKITLEADAKLALSRILGSRELQPKVLDPVKLESLAQAKHKIVDIQKQGADPDKVFPREFVTQLQEVFGAQTAYVVDSGNGMFVAMEHLRLDHPGCFLGPFDYSCMGYSVPAAIGAKLSQPQRPVVALVGDGAFLMTGLEMQTAVSYRAGVAFFILRDGELSQIAQFQQRSLNQKTLTTLAPIHLKSIAESLEMNFLKISTTDEIGSVLLKAKELTEKDKPVLVEVNIDYKKSTFFYQGVVKTNFLRFSFKDRLRLVARVIKRKISS